MVPMVLVLRPRRGAAVRTEDIDRKTTAADCHFRSKAISLLLGIAGQVRPGTTTPTCLLWPHRGTQNTHRHKCRMLKMGANAQSRGYRQYFLSSFKTVV